MADLYFVGVGMNWAREPIGDWWVAARRAVHVGQTLPLAIRRILDLNRRLPADRRIRALSISVGGGGAFERAIDEARREGLFVSAADLRLPRLGPLTFASPAAPDAYTTGGVPAGSWAIAHMAGRYALACEEDSGHVSGAIHGEDGHPRRAMTSNAQPPLGEAREHPAVTDPRSEHRQPLSVSEVRTLDW